MLDTAYLDNADHGNPGSDFCEGRFVAARHCSVPYFSFVQKVRPRMTELFVAKISQFPDGERRIV
ncbi:MAG: hypothetical protein WBW28_04685, partial [Pseudolabrys sp.]